MISAEVLTKLRSKISLELRRIAEAYERGERDMAILQTLEKTYWVGSADLKKIRIAVTLVIEESRELLKAQTLKKTCMHCGREGTGGFYRFGDNLFACLSLVACGDRKRAKSKPKPTRLRPPPQSGAVRAANRKKCPISCQCLCHDTGGGVHDHPGHPCPGKEAQPHPNPSNDCKKHGNRGIVTGCVECVAELRQGALCTAERTRIVTSMRGQAKILRAIAQGWPQSAQDLAEIAAETIESEADRIASGDTP